MAKPRRNRSTAWTEREIALLTEAADIDRCSISDFIREASLSSARRKVQLRRQKPFVPKPQAPEAVPESGPYDQY